MRNIEKSSELSDSDKRSIFLYADALLALDLDRPIEDRPLSAELAGLLQERDVARKAKNWAESDRIRDLLAGSGVAINDGPDGQSWNWI
jgi:cysteinyl-tRNA synthetase